MSMQYAQPFICEARSLIMCRSALSSPDSRRYPSSAAIALYAPGAIFQNSIRGFMPFPFSADECPLEERAVVEELLARDDVVLDGVQSDFLVRHALAAGLGGEVQRCINGELPRAGVRVAEEER